MVVEADAVQMDPQALKRVEELFSEQISSGLHPGAGLAVYRYGQPVLDLHDGLADDAANLPVTAETIFVLYSATKPLAAACIHILWERDSLAWDDAVARYWPDFAQNGKGAVTIRHLLSHQGGFPETPAELTWDKWRDWDAVIRAMENAVATYEPGTTMAYHARNFGWVIGELVQRIDGRPFKQFLKEEITGPLGMKDTYIGLPAELECRVSKVHAMEDCDRPEYPSVYNRPEVHQAVHPAGAGIAPARDIARFYAMLGLKGTLDGVQIFKPATVKETTTLQAEGIDKTLQEHIHRSLGLVLAEPRAGSSGGDDLHTFGHGGAGTSVGWADPDMGLAVAYITNGFRANVTNNPRLAAISQAVRDACR